MKEINLKSVSETLSAKELKNVVGGNTSAPIGGVVQRMVEPEDLTAGEVVVTPCKNPVFPCQTRGERCSYVSSYDNYLWTGTCIGNGDPINAVMHWDVGGIVCHGTTRLMKC